MRFPNSKTFFLNAQPSVISAWGQQGVSWRSQNRSQKCKKLCGRRAMLAASCHFEGLNRHHLVKKIASDWRNFVLCFRICFNWVFVQKILSEYFFYFFYIRLSYNFDLCYLLKILLFGSKINFWWRVIEPKTKFLLLFLYMWIT